MRYKKLTGIILKKQNYKEADQIVTIWTKEVGKVRFIAKSVLLAKSKLAYSLQDLSLVNIEVTGNKSLPVLISATTENNFKNLREELTKAGIAFYVTELMLKMTADEHPSKSVYELLVGFFEDLAVADIQKDKFYPKLNAFTLQLLTLLGFGTPKDSHDQKKINQFVEDILERNVKSNQFLASL